MLISCGDFTICSQIPCLPSLQKVETNPFPLNSSQYQCFAPDKQDEGKVMQRDFWEQVIKRMSLPPGPSLDHSLWRKQAAKSWRHWRSQRKGLCEGELGPPDESQHQLETMRVSHLENRFTHLFIFIFVPLAWGDISEKTLFQSMSKILLPIFSPRIFMV